MGDAKWKFWMRTILLLRMLGICVIVLLIYDQGGNRVIS